jgi:hypothetical protein
MKKNKAPKARVRRYYNQNMKDRLPQYPNRYKVAGLGENVDIIANPGTIGDVTAMPMSGENIQKLEKGVEAIDTALLNLENLSDKFALLDGTRGFTDPLLIKPSTNTGTHMVNFDMTSHPSLKTSTIDSLYVYGGLDSQYGGDYIGLRANLKDAASSDTYLIARSRTSSAGVKYLAWEMSTKHNDTDYLKNLNHLAAIGNLYNADGSLNSTLGGKIAAFQNNKYIHDGSLGTTNQKIDVTSGLLEIKGFSDGIMFYSGKSDTNSEYKSYTGIKYLKPDGTSGRYLDMMTDQKDYNYLSYNRDLSTKNTSKTHEVAVIGDIYDSRTGRTFFPKQIDMELSSYEKNARTYLAYSGASYMFENQEISLNTNNKPISIFSGFTFGWSDYDSASTSVSDYDINFSYIPNTDDELFSGGFLQYGSISFVLGTNIAGADNSICVKSVSLDKDGSLRGNTKDITPNHRDVVLREVWLHLY